MGRYIVLGILAILPVFLYAHAQDSARVDTLYQGMSIKLDLGNTALELGMSKGKVISTEVAMNWRLLYRLLPTLELGYANAQCGADGGQHKGQGGFLRVGMDLSPLKKHPEREHILLVGVRVGTALQDYSLTNVTTNMNEYWNDGAGIMNYNHIFRADAWGEIVAGCQVQVYKGFQMGWYARLKFLFTRTDKKGGPLPYYIPGFGYRDDTNWGLNYYIGYKF